MNIDLIKVIEKNQLKLDQHHHKLQQPKDIYLLNTIYNTNTFKNSNSIERSYGSTRKSTKQNSFVPNKSELSRLIDSASPISIKQSYIEQFNSVSPLRDDNSQIRIENIRLKDKLQIVERQVQQQEKAINALKKEKEILTIQIQNQNNTLKKELELVKKNSLNVEKTLQDQIEYLEQNIEKMKNNEQKQQNIEQNMQQLILDNEQLKQQKQEDNKGLKEIQEQFEIFLIKSNETKNKIDDMKFYMIQLSKIVSCLLSKQQPPLELIIQLNKQQKQNKFLDDQQILQKGNSLKLIFASVFSLQVESLVILNQILKEIKLMVDQFQNQYVSQVGLQLVSL